MLLRPAGQVTSNNFGAWDVVQSSGFKMVGHINIGGKTKFRVFLQVRATQIDRRKPGSTKCRLTDPHRLFKP